MGIYIVKSLHSNWIKIGHHKITDRRPSVYYRFVNRGFYSVVRPREIKDKVGFNDLELIYWFVNLDITDENNLHQRLRLLHEYHGEWYKYENLDDIIKIIYNDFNGIMKMPTNDEYNDAIEWSTNLRNKSRLY
tara:strand:- start:3700 stop:4098 length:399 start_codon:yes stop_codon:yes gene_type:complete